MATAQEVDCLTKSIFLFHAEPPHSKRRKVIINDCLKSLRALSTEPNYWSSKRVRTWFWNHRSDYEGCPDSNSSGISDLLMHSPPRTRLRSSQGSTSNNSVTSNSETNDVSSPISPLSPMYIAPDDNMQNRNKSLNESMDYTPSDFEDELSDSPMELNSPQSSKEQLLKPIPSATPSIRKSSSSNNNNSPISKNNLLYPSHKTWSIFSVRALGNQKNINDRWQNSSSGRISFNWCSVTGNIHWIHDDRFNTFRGKLNIEKRNTPPKWSEFLMHGRIGSELMERYNYPMNRKHNFKVYVRRLTSNLVIKCNRKLDELRKRDIELFGEDEFNSGKIVDELKVQEDDLEAKFIFYNDKGIKHGVRIFARRANAIVEACLWRPRNPKELELALQVVQQSLQQTLPLHTPTSITTQTQEPQPNQSQ